MRPPAGVPVRVSHNDRRVMSRLPAVVAALAVLAALPSVALGDAPPSHTVTANGTAQEKVTPSDRKHNGPIVAAVEAAHAAAIPKAIAEAREEAQLLAKASGLTLGALQAVAEQPAAPFGYGPFGAGYDIGPFGPKKFCGNERRPVFHTRNGKRHLVRFRKVHRCIVPPSVTAQLSVTFGAS
jgi:hypothetical protein